MPSNIQENIRAKREREAAKAAVRPSPQQYSDDDLVTVLYGFGKVLPSALSYLDEYEVRGGVIRNVPYGIAKYWKSGTRPDGKKPQGRVNVTILPGDATEDDFAAAAGLTREEQRKMAAVLTAGDAVHLVEDLGPEKARKLRDALSRYIESY